MKTNFKAMVSRLKSVANLFDEKNSKLRMQFLQKLSQSALPADKYLLHYFDVLLFICAYPSDFKQLKMAENELLRITMMMKKLKTGKEKLFINSGLPYALSVSKFSCDFVKWLCGQPGCRISIHEFSGGTADLNDVLRLTLPAVERSETTAGLDNLALLDSLLVSKHNRLSFLLSELGKLDQLPYVKDYLFDGLGLYINLKPLDRYFSRAYNRLPVMSVYTHRELIKKFDHETLLNTAVPPHRMLKEKLLQTAITTVKKAMALTDRETDPTTYPDENSFRLFELEHGITVCIYGMISERQLPLESYIGYTLFKNGFPAAYGGSWVFGTRANFGINIFDSFRGGESGYLMCQLLRVYRQVFGINYFEVEPYQYGLDNPEGIKSGAFWFYYRYGFRPTDKELLKMAKLEHVRIREGNGYRTSREVLIKFTESNIALQMGKKVPVAVPDITSGISVMIARKYHGDRSLAERECVKLFKVKTGWNEPFDPDENRVLVEVALWSEAIKIKDKIKLGLMKEMIKIKPVDVYKYQEVLLKFLNS